MGTISLLLPNEVSPEARQALHRACLTGGPDNVPTPTNIQVDETALTTQRLMDESGHLLAPWEVEGFGHLMTSTATLMEREPPYSLLVELSRGKVNQLRCQAEEWRQGGLMLPEKLEESIREASRAFGRTVTRESQDEVSEAAKDALRLGFESSSDLVAEYVRQVFDIRHQRQEKLDTPLSCRVQMGDDGPDFLTSAPEKFQETFNTITIPFHWSDIEPEEARYNWDKHDALLDWAEEQGLQVMGGPLVDFSASHLPDWLWLWEGDVNQIASNVCKFVEKTIHRYEKRIRSWQLTAGSNCARLLNLREEDLLGLTYRILDTARQVDSALDLVIGLGQPWGEYLLDDSHQASPSPYFFVDTLLRAGINYLSALEIEIVMGCEPRGSFCRDLLSASHLMDLYAFLGLPLFVTLGFPALPAEDPNADSEIKVGSGRWRDGYDAQTQADWARAFTELALCKPFVQCVQWAHYSDSQPHLFPNAGVLDADNNPRPALAELKKLREAHLR